MLDGAGAGMPTSPVGVRHEEAQLLVGDVGPKEESLVVRLKKVIVAGTGFMCDAYDLFVINLVLVIMKIVYKESADSAATISTAAIIGAIFGQITFGILADRIGRRKGFIITLSLVIVGGFGSALSFQEFSGFNIFVVLSLWRLILGFGIGGEYPLSATISSESSGNQHRRGQQVASVFSMQGVGILVSPIVVLILLHSLGDKHLDLVWRLALAMGAVPGVCMIYARITMRETQQFLAAKTAVDRPSTLSIMRKYWLQLLGTAGTWCIFDITFYANGLFNATIIDVTGLGRKEGDSDFQALSNTTLLSLYLAIMGLPGYFVAVALIDKVGRRPLQLIGFALLGLIYLIMGLFLDPLIKHAGWLFIFLYGLTFFFSNAGPNTTTFVLPSEVFPTQVRATCHGLSAAFGKMGAALGGAAIEPLFKAYGLSTALLVCAVIAFIGFGWTFLLVQETMGKPLTDSTFDEVSLPVYKFMKRKQPDK